MRVTKVKVKDNGKDVMVLMQRESLKGSLIFDSENRFDQTECILPGKKRDNFALSILNKTLVKKETIRANKNESLQELKRKYQIILDILKKKFLPKTILEQNVLPFLNHKFSGEIKYFPTKDSSKPISFNLCQLIQLAVEHQSYDDLKPYDDWKEWFIKQKSEALKKSIRYNKIAPDNTDNKRQQALHTWSEEFTKNGKIDLADCERYFQTDNLAAKLKETYNECVKKADERKTGFEEIQNEFHRELKNTLQEHQREIFGSREEPNISNREDVFLYTYQLEAVKYLERYFSVKQSDRKNTVEDILYYLKSDTIKSIIKKQLINAIRNRLLQQGKAIHHLHEGCTNSDILSSLKRDEALKLKMFDACAFATNNIRNIVDKTQQRDILGKNDYKNSVQNGTYDPYLFRLFFLMDLPTDSERKMSTLWALRGSVQKIRNEILHYKKEAQNRIFNITHFEYPDHPDVLYSSSLFKECLENEIKQLPDAFARQMASGGILSYYSMSDILQLLNNFRFSLYRPTVPFAPGFKKVHKQGQHYQNAEKDAGFYDLGLNFYLSTETFEPEVYNARYYLMKLIYNNLFLPRFTQDRKAFASTVDQIKSINREYASNSHKPNAYAFEAIRDMKPEESIKQYMAYIQSYWILEISKNESHTEKNNFEKFLLQVFASAFNKFLNQDNLAFVNNPIIQINSELNKQQRADWLNKNETIIRDQCLSIRPLSIDAGQPEHIAFYTFAKLLDADHLSTLRNEFIKYQASSTEKFPFDYIFEIIELCLYSCDKIPTNYLDLYSDAENSMKTIVPFIAQEADVTNWDDLFVQEDKKTPVIHSAIEICRKYGTASMLEKLVSLKPEFKLSESDYLFWKSGKDTIENSIKERERLHTYWEEAIKKDAQKKITEKERQRKMGKNYRSDYANDVSFFMNKHSEKYAELCKSIDHYNWLDNKLHFVHLNRIHSLTIELLSRLAGFVNLFERDFEYLSSCFGKKNSSMTLKFSCGLPKENDINEQYRKVFLSYNYRETRIYIAHFKYLTETASKSIIDLINETRNLVSYDRKLKNAVSKAIIEIFDKHGMILELGFSKLGIPGINVDHRLELIDVKPKPIYHLGTKENKQGKPVIKTIQVSEEYAQLCKSLLEMKK